LLPAVPLSKFTRSEPRAGRRFDKPAPRSTPCGRNRVSRFEPNWCASSAHKLGSLPHLCWPLAGLSVGRKTSAPAVLDRWPPVYRTACTPPHPQQHRFSSLQRSQLGLSKRNNFRSPSVCRDAQRRADKLGRHARRGSSRPSSPSCQGESEKVHPENGLQRP
jgi:hypothetical protein